MGLESFRVDFPMLEQEMVGHPLIYLDSAATALTPTPVIETIADFYRHSYGTVNRAVYGLAAQATSRYNEVRVAIARFLNAESPSEIIFTKGTTEALNLLAHCLGHTVVGEGDEIIVTEIEHHANLIPWQRLCRERGATLKLLPADDRGVLDLEAFESLLSERTRVVALAHISNVLGTIHPIQKITEMAHRHGALVVVDGAQAAPHMPIDVQKLGVDFYAFSGHKLYGPTGIGVLYGKRELLNALPPYQVGGDMVDNVELHSALFAQAPRRFESGTPNIAGVLGLGAAVDYLSKIGMEGIAAHEATLLKVATERVCSIDGVKLLGEAPNRGAILNFTVRGCHALDVGTLLGLRGIAVRTGYHCAQPAVERFGGGQSVRASFGLYNTVEEVEQFADALKGVIHQVRA